MWRVTVWVKGERWGVVFVGGDWGLLMNSEGWRVKGAKFAIRFRGKRLCGGEG